MARKDYLPTNEDELVSWNTNYQTALAAHGTALGLTAEEIEEATGACTSINAELQAVDLRGRALRTAVTKKDQVRKTGVSKLRILNERIKTLPTYTSAIGESLGIIGPEMSVGNCPVMKKTEVTPQGVKVRFQKKGFTSVNIYRIRVGEQGSYEKVGTATGSPYVDETILRVPAGAYAYKAIGCKKNIETGQFSDTLEIAFAG